MKQYVLVVVLAYFCILVSAKTSYADSALNIELGRQLYQQGILSNGIPLSAFGEGGSRLTGLQVTCINCHKRSGLGSSEGGILAPAITHKLLYQRREIIHKEISSKHSNNISIRPAYTDMTLRTAIEKGINPGGRRLDTFMPRFSMPKMI